MPKLTINGQEVEVEQGKTILQAAEKLGIFIPHFCYHKDLSLAGNCRMCQVEVEKSPKLVISCATVAAEGMVVYTNSEKVKKTTGGVMEFLLLNHPIDCPICDQAGECFLQDYYMTYALHNSRIDLNDKVRKRKVIDLGNQIILDTERCVLCSRCIRFCEEVSKTRELQFIQRSNRVEITTYFDKPIDNPYSGNLFEICPVGALTSKDFRFKCRVWFLQRTKSICPACSTACNIFLCHSHKMMGGYTADGLRESIVYRFFSRNNPEVNKSWLCDEGRMSYKLINSPDRLKKALRKTRGGTELSEIGQNEALGMLHEKLKSIKEKYGPESIVGIASPQRTNEDIFLFKKYFKEVIKSSNLFMGETLGEKSATRREDEILRRVDKNPNTMGALEIGIPAVIDSERILNIIKDGKVKALYLMNPKTVTEKSGEEKFREALAKVEFVVTHATHKNDGLNAFDLVLPVSVFAEKDGTFTNYAKRVQRINKAFNAPGDSISDWEIVAELMKRTGYPVKASNAEEVFTALSEEVPSFKGLTYTSIGDGGKVLGS
ncbi:MAG: hypothetical protein A2042_07265 [Candidatus Schekmanbacteria bacterium GWA2_38_11]|uniref:NADH dehydrogenase n=1 Tax=Candidatus Schekmanbacteria bacterium GWA2_38_11 TaxID=1817876 RepID=A0A1F7RD85_9BACT|nr:MAG: hypothetical protein A2042_07265 [Candidatus Schekmanbacteria bacterium GWA2_38_11]